MSEFNYKKYLANNPLLKEGEEINEMDLRKGDVVKFKDGSRITIVGPKGDGFDYMDGNEKGYQHYKNIFRIILTDLLFRIPSNGLRRIIQNSFDIN